MSITVYATTEELTHDLAELILRKSYEGNVINIALSGGSTPLVLFDLLAKEQYSNKVLWGNLHFWWVDERCVNPDSDESNFGQFKRRLADVVGIYDVNIHRMRGEVEAAEEALAYNDLLDESLPKNNSLPQFDLMFLGMGDDGHTASLFPNNESNVIKEFKYAAAVAHPQTGQKRVTLTMSVINNTKQIIFMVTGKNKRDVLEQVLNNRGSQYPAAQVKPTYGVLEWHVDEAAFEKE